MRRHHNLGVSYDPAAGAGACLVFDDESLEAILYGAPSPGPSCADLFVASKADRAAIDAAMEGDDPTPALGLMADFLEARKPVPDAVLMGFVWFVRRFVPAVPCPVIQAHGVAYDRILKPCFELGRLRRNAKLANEAGTLLYRWYESCGRYRAAADVVGRLLEDAQQKGDHLSEAQLTNNLGYEHLLERRWEAAVPYFWRSARLFERLGDAGEVANARANDLACEADRYGPAHLLSKRAELIGLARTLGRRGDWRVRKPLVLLARVLASQGNYRKAIVYAQRAVTAGREVATRHHLEDREYLAELRAEGSTHGGAGGEVDRR